MREHTRVAIESCLFALNLEYTAEERESLSLPPYPLPDRLAAHHEIVLAEVERLRREGETVHSCVRAILAHPEPWEQLADGLGRAHGDDFFVTATILIFAASDMTTAEFEAAIARLPDAITRDKLRSQLVHILAGKDELTEAARVCESFEPFRGADQRYLGYRIVARHLAEQGRAKDFFRLWPRLAAGKDRDHLGNLRGILIRSVAREHGWRSALEVVADKRVGPKYIGCAFEPLAQAGRVEQLLAIFSSSRDLIGLDELGELAILVTALVAEAKISGARTEPFADVLDRIIALDFTDKSVMRTRDQLLLSLWPAYPDASTLALARKAARASRVKAELKTLHPHVARPGS